MLRLASLLLRAFPPTYSSTIPVTSSVRLAMLASRQPNLFKRSMLMLCISLHLCLILMCSLILLSFQRSIFLTSLLFHVQFSRSSFGFRYASYCCVGFITRILKCTIRTPPVLAISPPCATRFSLASFEGVPSKPNNVSSYYSERISSV